MEENKYDAIITNAMMEYVLFINKTGAKALILTNIDDRKVADMVMIKVAASFKGAFSFKIYLKNNLFRYIIMRLKNKTSLPYYWPWTKEDAVELDKDGAEFFDRPCKAEEKSISVLKFIWEDYYA